MFRNTFQSGFLSILYAIGSKPLQIWRKNINNGYVKRITDFEMQSSVIEICGANVSTCFLTCPSNPKQTLGVKMPFLVLLIKYLKKYFTFEVQVIDDKNVKRRFRASNYQSNTRVKPFICTIPMKMDPNMNMMRLGFVKFENDRISFVFNSFNTISRIVSETQSEIFEDNMNYLESYLKTALDLKQLLIDSKADLCSKDSAEIDLSLDVIDKSTFINMFA